MHSKLFEIGPLEIHSYGLALALSFLLGIYFSMYRAKKQGIDPNNVVDLSVGIVISAILGARFLYVIFHLEEFKGHWLDTINPVQSSGQVGIAGLTMLGGFIAALLFSIIFMKIKKMPVLKISDIMVPALGLGIFVTRIGCFLNGCCYGVPTEMPWGMVFPQESPAGYCFPGEAIHPAQLYSSFYGLIILGVTLLLERFKKFDGFLLFIFFILYGISRFTVDVFRYYENSMVLLQMRNFSVSVNQGISLLLIVFGVAFIIFKSKRIEKINLDEKIPEKK